MTTEKSKNQVIAYLEELDENKNYPADFAVFVSEINKIIQVPIITNTPSGTSGQEYTLSYLLSLPSRNDLGFDFDSLIPYKDALTQPENFESYINSLNQFFTDAALEQEVTASTGDTYTIRVAIDTTQLDEISNNVLNWNTTSTEDQAFNPDQPKVPGIVEFTQRGQEPETGDVYFKSYDFYSGPNMAINQSNQYIDPKTGELKKDAQGNVLTPIFRAGSASSLFEGMSQDAIFEIQKELIDVGLDVSSYPFVAGVVDFSAKGQEVDFVAQLMTQANDANAMFPQLNLIDKNAPTLIGMLRPYLEYKKGIDEQTNATLEGLSEYASEIVPPTEAEVKSVVDQLFIERGINPTARDYQKYATIFANLQKDSANRAAEIEKNKLSLNDVIGLSTSYDTTTEIGPYTYGGFGISTPSPAEARAALGKPLLQPIDPIFELGKLMDDMEAGRIDASQELTARAAQAAQFKSNFMQFEENF